MQCIVSRILHNHHKFCSCAPTIRNQSFEHSVHWLIIISLCRGCDLIFLTPAWFPFEEGNVTWFHTEVLNYDSWNIIIGDTECNAVITLFNRPIIKDANAWFNIAYFIMPQIFFTCLYVCLLSTLVFNQSLLNLWTVHDGDFIVCIFQK